MRQDKFFLYFSNKAWIRDRPIFVLIIVIKTPLFENRCDICRFEAMWEDARCKIKLNRSVTEGRIDSRHSIKSLEGMGSSSHDLGAK